MVHKDIIWDCSFRSEDSPLFIADSGGSAIGKTLAIKTVYSLLKAKGYKLLEEQWQYAPESDIQAIFDVNGIKVGVESQGDSGSDMKSTIELFVKSVCEIIGTYCRKDSSKFDKLSSDSRNIIV